MTPPHAPVTRHRAKGFTLIELMVSISIISLLIAILIPALGTARETARSIQCASNQRQVMLLISLYAEDHRGRPPYCVWDRQATDDISSYGSYGGGLVSAGLEPKPILFLCPSQQGTAVREWLGNGTGDWGRKSANWQYVGYGANRFGFMPRATDRELATPRYRPEIDWIGGRASRLLGLADALRTINVDTYAGGDQLRPGSNENLLAPRHVGESSNLAFVDGHVERTEVRNLNFDPRIGAYGEWSGVNNTVRQGDPWQENNSLR